MKQKQIMYSIVGITLFSSIAFFACKEKVHHPETLNVA